MANLSETHVPAVDVTVVGDAAGAEAVLSRVVSWFPSETARSCGRAQSLDASAVFAAQDQPGVRIWIWLRAPTSARLFFRVQQAQLEPRYLVTDVTLDRGLDELGIEELAQVAYSSAGALWAGTLQSRPDEVRAGLETAPRAATTVVARQPPSRAPRATASSSGLRARLGVEYALRWAGDERAVQHPSLSVGLWLHSRQRELGAALYAGPLIPRSVEHGDLKLDLTGAALSVRGGATWSLAGDWWLGAELGPGLEILRYEPESLDPEHFRVEPSGTDWRPVLLATASVRAELSGLGFFAGAQLSALLERPHFDEQDATVRKEVLSPWPVQPGGMLGVVW